MIRLFYNYYEDKVPARKKEIDFCLQKNLANRHMSTVIIEMKENPTYNFLFNQINKRTAPDDINIICNSDIFFDETILRTFSMKEDEAWLLSRWEWANKDKIVFSNRSDSQDAWIVKGKVKPIFGEFTLGMLGCDNRIAHEFQEAKYKVSNPSLSVKTYHVHNSGSRNYTKQDVIPPPYLTIPPTRL